MWIVRLALRRPYTFVVAAMLLIILGIVTIQNMAKDIFPYIDIPVVSVIWSFNGLPPEDMERRVMTVSERAMTTTVNDIEHIESESYYGIGVIKVFFHPNAKIEESIAEVTAICQSVTRILPPGITPPLIIRYSASSVPILQASLNSKTLPEQALADYGTNFIRTQMATVQGASVPSPYGGKSRTIMVDLDPQALISKGLSATDVSNAINAQNLILPTGTAKIGEREYNVRLNSSPEVVEALNDLPIKQVNGAVVYIKDVAHVRDGFTVQTNIVRTDGQRSAMISVLKNGGASTLDIVKRVKEALPRIQATLPKELTVNLLFDQSIFVQAAINGVMTEGVIAAALTAAMILLFLGSWRSTLIVAVSIPLSIICSIIMLRILGHTLNVMTLGGLALAVGILVDDATVEIENIHRNLGMGKGMNRAILDGAQQIATPAFVSTLSICIVFVPVFLLSGSARFLFVPLAEAVAFAMLASYVLSRTLIPTLVKYLLRSEIGMYQHPHDENPNPEPGWDTVGDKADGNEAHTITKKRKSPGMIWAFHFRFNRGFERMRDFYAGALGWILHHRLAVGSAFIIFVLASLALVPYLGEDFFPQVDAGQIRLHVRAPAGTRIEETEKLFGQVDASIRQVIPANELTTIIDNIGLPYSGLNLAYSDSVTVGPSDGEILIALRSGEHGSTPGYVKKLREKLVTEFPEATFFFQPADIVSQILNFGLPSPIDIQIFGANRVENYKLAQDLQAQVARIPGTVDVHVKQVVNQPELRVNVDRTRAQGVGLSQRDVASNLLISLSSSGQTAPNFWLNPANGVNYFVAVQTPQTKINSLADLVNTPISNAGRPDQLLSNVATTERSVSYADISHYNVQPIFDVFVNVQGRDLGGVSADVEKIIAQFNPKLPKGSYIVVRGQVESMRSSFLGLSAGLIFAVLLVYFLMVVNFQSWIDPFIILMALPGALAGIVWALFITHTTISVPSLMGAIMSIGVATANSILLVTFANEKRQEGDNAMEAALAAGFTRLRPVLMTAAAMIIGMLPMSLGVGEGGEQNAPLGRAVIGGLLIATFTTLIFVPIMYSVLRHNEPVIGDLSALEPMG